MINSSILIKPLITEKSTRLRKSNTYSIIVGIKVNKDQVAEALKTLYKVNIKQVRISVRKGKVVRVGKRRIEKKQPDIKIAYVTLKDGTLDIIPSA